MTLSHTQRSAARRLGVSVGFFRVHVLPGLRVARVGGRTLIPESELEAWLDRESELV